MRPSQKSNRSRGKSNRKNLGNNINRVYESAGPEGKVRGTPQQIIDKYNALARDAQTSGDRVVAENFLQHAEHYQRLLSAAQAAVNERRDQANGASQRGGQNDDDASEDESVAQAATEAPESRPAEVNGMATLDGAEPTELVETPEAAPVRKRAPRTRRPRADKSAAADAPAAEADKAAPAEQATPEAL
jgi:rubrerythrin